MHAARGLALRVWKRLRNPVAWPRIWWYPPSSRLPAISWTEQEAQDQATALQSHHDSCSRTVQHTMTVLVGLALFCCVTALAAPDQSLLFGENTVQIPFAGVAVSFPAFLFIGPSLLLAVTL